MWMTLGPFWELLLETGRVCRLNRGAGFFGMVMSLGGPHRLPSLSDLSSLAVLCSLSFLFSGETLLTFPLSSFPPGGPGSLFRLSPSSCRGEENSFFAAMGSTLLAGVSVAKKRMGLRLPSSSLGCSRLGEM